MNDRLVATDEPTTRVSQAAVLRTAAEALRDRAREVPRGPWRWAEPDLDVTEPLLGPAAPWRPTRHAALEATRPTAGPQPAHPVCADVIDPEIGDALATLLERVAEQLEDSGTESAGNTERAAVAVARGVLRATAESAGTTAVERKLGVQS